MRMMITTTVLSAALAASAVAVAADSNYDTGSSDVNTPSDTSQQPGMAGDQGYSDQGYSSDQSTNAGQPGTIEGQPAVSEAQAPSPTGRYLKSEKIGIRPQVGAMMFKDPSDTNRARGVAGITIDANIAGWLPSPLNYFYFGPESGVLYSHVGDPTNTNFFGTGTSNATLATGTSANFLEIPLDVKLGYNILDNFRLAVHGGGNYTYRSVASSLNFGSSSFGTGSVWKIFPNVGGDVEFGLGQHVALTLRPDVTLTPGNDLYMGTVALAIPIG